MSDYKFVFRLVSHDDSYEYDVSISESEINAYKQTFASYGDACKIVWELLDQVDSDLYDQIDSNDVCWEDVHVYDDDGKDLLKMLQEGSQ